MINKIDEEIKPFLESYQDLAKLFDQVIEVSALRGKNIKALLDSVFDLMPEGEAFYPEFQLSNLPHEQWVAELVREKLFLRLREEVPYAVSVEVSAIEPRENGTTYIAATIFTNQDRYKNMIIGRGGQGIKEIGQSVRKELEGISDKKVYLDLHVEYDPHWVERMN